MTNKEVLGQIFTRRLLADYMVDMFTLPRGSRVLDPCFGGGVFLDSLSETSQYESFGMEIDPVLVKQYEDKSSSAKIEMVDFLNYEIVECFDGVIMNPPYIRHEKINNLASFGVDKKKLRSDPLYKELPANANMFMYFIVKALDAIKEGGELVVVYPRAWMKTRAGANFSRLLRSKSTIDEEVFVRGVPFEDEALVDVVVQKIIKSRINKRTTIGHIYVSDSAIKNIHGKSDEAPKHGRGDFLVPLKSVASIRRGITTGSNAVFINPNLPTKSDKFLKRIVSTPKAINGYTTENATADSLLVIDGEEIAAGLRRYIGMQKEEIIRSKQPTTLYRKIENNKVWYRLKTFDCRGIWFNYFIRSDIRFIYNGADLLARDNFYIIKSNEVDPLVMSALLNNYYVYYRIEQLGKHYGNGLLKIQKYDLDELMVVKIDVLPQDSVESLRQLGGELLRGVNPAGAILKITHLLAEYEDDPACGIISLYERAKSTRLEKICDK